jgi:hypothetical protein
MRKRRGFIYWAFDLLALLLIGVILLSYYFHLSAVWEQALLIIAIVGIYGLIALWWWANPAAMIEPKDELVTQHQEAGPHLTQVQAHYRQVIEMIQKGNYDNVNSI